ncbi:MAG: DUF3120 domain-containing protein [Synechococcaceae cyanobacterium]|nr:DUF3120 domain-containing protein [Synechococcaceae cyanobacterium]
MANFLHIQVIGVSSSLPSPSRAVAADLAAPALAVLPGICGLRSTARLGLNLSVLASFLVAVPVFVQAPWVRLAPMAAALFTIPLLALGVVLEQRAEGRPRQLGVLLVGFAGSWLGGSLFWGWCRLHPLWHLPVEAFALPLAVAGLGGRWRLAAGFYLASLLGTAATDGVMALSGIMEFWPAVLAAPPSEAPALLQDAAVAVLRPAPLALTLVAGLLLIQLGRWLWRRGDETSQVAGATLITTLAVDAVFLLAAGLAPGLSGLI